MPFKVKYEKPKKKTVSNKPINYRDTRKALTYTNKVVTTLLIMQLIALPCVIYVSYRNGNDLTTIYTNLSDNMRDILLTWLGKSTVENISKSIFGENGENQQTIFDVMEAKYKVQNNNENDLGDDI